MRFRCQNFVRQTARGLMLLAMAAFLQQASVGTAAQAMAAAGFMPQPAETLSGSVHVHGKVTGHVHTHDGDIAGHTHHPADHDNEDQTASLPCWTLGSVSIVVTQCPAVAVSFEFKRMVVAVPSEQRDGTEPDRPSRPPSTPSIA